MNHAAARARLALAAALALGPACALVPAGATAQSAVAPTPANPASASKPRDASLGDYRAHLQALSALVDSCAKARDVKTCDPAAVGPDDQVPAPQAVNAQPATQPNSPKRLVRYGWLRVLLAKAREPDPAPDAAPTAKPKTAPTTQQQAWENVRPTPPTTTELLVSAKQRLATDLAQAGAPLQLADHGPQRAAMKQVLAQRAFADLEETSTKETPFEKLGNWLNHALESAMKASARAPWLGRTLVWGFIGLVCVALVWGLLQLERRWRIRLIPDDRTPAPGAASAIPWQVWLDDARRAAQAGLWREAIHFLYWASISRLESKRLWPADRARTPREYLALVAADDPRRAGLATLTGSFERVWYGGRAAGESDYQRAEQLAAALIGAGASGGNGQ